MGKGKKQGVFHFICPSCSHWLGCAWAFGPVAASRVARLVESIRFKRLAMAGGVVLFSGTHLSQGHTHTRTPHTRHSSWQHWIPTLRTLFFFFVPFFPPYTYARRHSNHPFFAAFCNAILVGLTHVVHTPECVLEGGSKRNKPETSTGRGELAGNC